MARRTRGHVGSQPSDAHMHTATNAMVNNYFDYSSELTGPVDNNGPAPEYAPHPRAMAAGASAPDIPDIPDIPGDYGDLPISKYAADLLSAAQVILYISASRESQQAFEALEEAHARFVARVAHDEPAPSAQWGGSLFEGLAAIKDLASTLQKLDRDLQKRIPAKLPHGFSAPDSRLSQWMEQERERQLAESRAVLRKLLQQSGATGK